MKNIIRVGYLPIYVDDEGFIVNTNTGVCSACENETQVMYINDDFICKFCYMILTENGAGIS